MLAFADDSGCSSSGDLERNPGGAGRSGLSARSAMSIEQMEQVDCDAHYGTVGGGVIVSLYNRGEDVGQGLKMI